MSADWGSLFDWGGDTGSTDYSAPVTDYSNYDYSQPTYDTSSSPVAPTDTSAPQVYPDGQGGFTDINGNQVDSTGQPITYGSNGDQYDSNGNIINKASPFQQTANDQTISPDQQPAGYDVNGNPIDSNGNIMSNVAKGPGMMNGQNRSGGGNQIGMPGEQAGPPNPYANGQSPNYNYPGGMNNPNGSSSGGGLLGSLFGGGGSSGQGGSGGGGLFGGSTGSDLLTLLGVGGALAFLPKLLNSASGGSSGTTVTAPDYSAQWRNMPALPNYSPNLAQAGTNPGMAMNTNPLAGVNTQPASPGSPQASGPVSPLAAAASPIMFPGQQG